VTRRIGRHPLTRLPPNLAKHIDKRTTHGAGGSLLRPADLVGQCAVKPAHDLQGKMYSAVPDHHVAFAPACSEEPWRPARSAEALVSTLRTLNDGRPMAARARRAAIMAAA